MLCDARNSLGLSVADVAAMTRIPKAMLKHLEADRYDEYAAEVFVRGHLRNYAREVQLEPELILKAFDRHTGNLKKTPELEEELDTDAEEESEAVEPLADGTWFDWDVDRVRKHVQPAHLVAVGLVLVALFVVFGVLTGQRATAQKDTDFSESSGAAADGWQPDEETRESRWELDQSPDGPQDDGSD